MMDGMEEVLHSETNGTKSGRSDTVDLNDSTLQVDISDALSEREKVKFTVHTKTTLPDYNKPEFSVVRQHEEFIWLHDRFDENEDYAGYIIPPPPPRPDFDASREKLQKLGEGEGSMTKEEFNKMKQELEAEYLATFKKTVAMHEVFLTRLAQHPIFRTDHNFKVFLEYEQDLSVRTKNKKEKVEGLFRSINRSTDEILLAATQKDVDDYFEKEKGFLLEYHAAIKDSTLKADKMTQAHKTGVADSYIKLSTGLSQLGTIEGPRLEKFINKVSDTFEKARKVEGRVASDEDLKLSDTLRYYVRDGSAAKDLLYRRLRCLANYEQANKNLDRARAKNKDVHAAELAQQNACERFEHMSARAKEELNSFKTRRVAAFKKNLIELAELELKHAKAQAQLLKNCLQALQEE
ncbi:sorting nexin-6-like isoform X3 [Penaeus japonicus]|uniref:sorting nexin-6-like isoform X3 n=1 Tax=Penaeus japonicus TaxID=27405 RepID=UPI001C70E9AE|nr:sorting nexin-6-like isoform X3 [Penaeus japonicus]